MVEITLSKQQVVGGGEQGRTNKKKKTCSAQTAQLPHLGPEHVICYSYLLRRILPAST